jgi:hypothetical protein
MFEGEYDLTFEEEASIEQPANIYSIVRTLDFIEWAFNSGHIDKESYMEHSNLIMDQYKTSVDALDKFPGIDIFAQKYGLSDFKLGINRLKQGAVQISSGTNTVSIHIKCNGICLKLFNLFTNKLSMSNYNYY